MTRRPTGLDYCSNPVRGAQTLRAFIRRCRRVQRGDETRPGRGRRLSGLGGRRWSVRQRTSGQVSTKHRLRQALLLVRWAPRVRSRQRCSGNSTTDYRSKENSTSLDDLVRLIKHPSIEYRPELRWWLAEGLHTDETLRYEIDTAYRLGFGGMEFLAMDEGNIDHARYGWGAEEWVHDSQLVVEETTRRNMSVSFTSGTGWANANLPTIDPDHPAASRELDVVSEDLVAGACRQGPLPRIDLEAEPAELLPGQQRGPVRGQVLVAVVAARVLEDKPEGAILDVDTVVDLTAQVRDEALNWTAPDDGTWRLFVYWMRGTGQTASPSAWVNYTVNYLDPDGVQAVIDYWNSVVLTPELREQISRNPRAQMYMDSLELFTTGAGGLLWGRTVAEEFRARRGYDITPWLPFLTRSVMLFAATTSSG
jgi:alpha-L-rhamnosidase